MQKKKKIHYERGTEELRLKNIRAHKLVQEFNNSAVVFFEKRGNDSTIVWFCWC